MYTSIDNFMDEIITKNPSQDEFHQAVQEVVESLWDFIKDNPQYEHNRILERITEPERVIMFRVPWMDDNGIIQVNRGYRIEFNSAIGPYKGGLRFHPSVDLGILKFLGFEQIFKNSLTTLPMGGGKGGSDFDPKGKSDNEVMNFCQSFMSELFRHIGPDTDVPAGDIGVGGREIGYMFGQYKKLKNQFSGVLTGKGLNWGGSLIRPEATGYGAVYFAQEMLSTINEDLSGKIVTISGSGNVAQYACEKAIDLGAKVVSMSDSSGTIFDDNGINKDRLQWIMDLKNIRRGRIEEYSQKYKTQYLKDKNPWGIKSDIALPCATQNEISLSDAKALISNNCICITEGANMPTEPDAVNYFEEKSVLFGPGKAANAGGVSVSGLEMTQNSMRLNWSREEVDMKLQSIMKNIHEKCLMHGTNRRKVNYVKGANIAGFIKVADAMLDQGCV